MIRAPSAGALRRLLRSRRQVLRDGVFGLGLLMGGGWLSACGDGDGGGNGTSSNIANLGPLNPADANGVRLPDGFTSRILARSGEPVFATSDYRWHGSPDGGAVFAANDGGWIYVSNSELPLGLGGAGALRFDRDGELVDAYSILSGTNLNCAGGPTPWGTWLSCEEDFADHGAVFECDPHGVNEAIARPALGLFRHEAACVDPINHQVYLTEDDGNGRFYRFSPSRLTADGYADLSDGLLEAARVADLDTVLAGGSSAVDWLPIPDPSAATVLTRDQAPESTRFRGGEGIWYRAGVAHFSTKGDTRVWSYDIERQTLSLIYDAADFGPAAVLTNVDNVTASEDGDVLVAEDGGDLQLVALTPGGLIVPLLQLEGQDASEIAGPAFDPSGTRLYFSSQRGPRGDFIAGGITYVVEGPFVF